MKKIFKKITVNKNFAMPRFALHQSLVTSIDCSLCAVACGWGPTGSDVKEFHFARGLVEIPEVPRYPKSIVTC